MIQNHDAPDWFRKIHESPWESEVSLHPGFSFIKHQVKLQDFKKDKDNYKLLYFDAFSPEIQPELWTQEIFDKLSRMMKKEGILVTYSAKGSVRRALESAGFRVERIPGPKGKREMIRAMKM
jgi:tRNA U34 5-methylaminomethyl-2-thiouridine-forming methyltransferase MnmC